MIGFTPDIYKFRLQPITAAVMARTVEAFRQRATGELVQSPEWRFGLVVDDIIAHTHDVDPDLPWNKRPAATAAGFARYLGWLTRDRRIKLGKRMLDVCLKSEATREPRYFTHFQKSRGTVAVYLASGEPRKERLDHLQFLVTYAHFKYQTTTFVEQDGDTEIIDHREWWANELYLVYADGRTLKLTETPAKKEGETDGECTPAVRAA
jgi:hypothetical protein